MKISTRGRYGTRLLIDLALHLNGERVLLRDVALRQDISLMYLERLIAPLVSAGIVRTIRGPKGGISLAKPPKQIRLSEVMSILEGSTAPVECVDNPMLCNRSKTCATRDIWDGIKKQTDMILESTTIYDLVERQKRKVKIEEPMYDI
jgi:Rrf2 family protein